MGRLLAVHAIFKDGGLIFSDPALAPQDGTDVVITYVEEPRYEVSGEMDPLQALRGRGKGERLVERLLQSRREDREDDERSFRRLRA